MTTELRRLRTVLIALVVLSACASKAPPPTLVTPQGQVAYRVEDALDAIAALQHTAIMARRSNAITTKALRTIVYATTGATRTISAAIDSGGDVTSTLKEAFSALQQAQALLSLDEQKQANIGALFTNALAILTALSQH